MKYVKHQIPEEISDKGGASVQLVAKQTIPLDGAIDAALEAHYCIGQKPAIMNNVFGALKSMAAGVRRDGRPRRIDGFLGLYPVFKGKVDLTKGFDPAENKVQIKARLLNEMILDTKKWTFEDGTRLDFRFEFMHSTSDFDGKECELTFTCHGGVAGSPAQTVTASTTLLRTLVQLVYAVVRVAE